MIELEKKAEECYWNSDASGSLSSKKCYTLGFIAGAKEVQKENEQLQQKWLESEFEKSKLVSQVEKMKCCENCKHPTKDSTGCCCPFAASCRNRSLWEMDAD